MWNIKVLKDEEMHRDQHLAGECLCEVVFEGEDREKRLRPRPKSKQAKEAIKEIRESPKYVEASGPGNEQRGRSRYQNVEQRQAGVRDEDHGRRSKRGETHHDTGNASPVVHHQSGHRGSRDGVQYGYVLREHAGAEVNPGESFRNAGDSGEGHVIGVPNTELVIETHNNRGYQPPFISAMAALSMHAGQDQGPSAFARQSWDPAAKEAAYQYVGYLANDPPAQRHAVPAYEQGYGTAALGGLYPNNLVWQGQPMLNQPGGGMKWYPESSQPAAIEEKIQPAPEVIEKSSKKPQTWTKMWPKAYSEPNNRPYQAYAESVADDAEEMASPVVVSSDMARAGR
jgi:hypothetical protein